MNPSPRPAATDTYHWYTVRLISYTPQLAQQSDNIYVSYIPVNINDVTEDITTAGSRCTSGDYQSQMTTNNHKASLMRHLGADLAVNILQLVNSSNVLSRKGGRYS